MFLLMIQWSRRKEVLSTTQPSWKTKCLVEANNNLLPILAWKERHKWPNLARLWQLFTRNQSTYVSPREYCVIYLFIVFIIFLDLPMSFYLKIELRLADRLVNNMLTNSFGLLPGKDALVGHQRLTIQGILRSRTNKLSSKKLRLLEFKTSFSPSKCIIRFFKILVRDSKALKHALKALWKYSAQKHRCLCRSPGEHRRPSNTPQGKTSGCLPVRSPRAQDDHTLQCS